MPVAVATRGDRSATGCAQKVVSHPPTILLHMQKHPVLMRLRIEAVRGGEGHAGTTRRHHILVHGVPAADCRGSEFEGQRRHILACLT